MIPAYLHMDPFLSSSDADGMLRIAEAFGSFGTYANEATSEGLGEDLPQRFDVGLNYFDSGIDGLGNDDAPAIAASRTNYFRETYAYGNVIEAPGIQAFMEHSALRATARQISNRDNIVPAIVYANLLIPGQELAIHTDVPEFRGANRKLTPQWLLVCMLHSGLFEQWRVPILTCVSWFGHSRGGAFTFYLEGPGSPRHAIPATHNSAILIDTDMVFHGVERVSQLLPDLPVISQHTRLFFCEGRRWELREGEQVLGEYLWEDLRYSISWKAYCFEDEAEQLTWSEGSDELSLDKILAMLEADLRERDVLSGPRPEPTEFALMMVENFIKFPSLS
ncbi:MAG: hypothetical protein ACI9DH_001640 [Halioglobus sp.]|jgi:hypothetical protein